MGPKIRKKKKISDVPIECDDRVLGANPTFDIWHPSYATVSHCSPHPQAFFEDEEEQTFCMRLFGKCKDHPRKLLDPMKQK